MKKFWTVAALSLTLASLQPLAAKAAVMNFSANLNQAQETPPTGSPATGTLTGTLTTNPGQNVFNYTVNFSNLTTPVTMAHIHDAPPGVKGPIVHPPSNMNSILGLVSGSLTDTWSSSDLTNPLTDAFVQDLMSGKLYFNIHTTQFPDGEIRGQIISATAAPSPIPEPSATLGLLLLGAGGATYRFKKSNC